jgi:hypothetical protein
VVVTRKLTREEAAQKYGEITKEGFGPRGGSRSVTFGDKKFINDYYIHPGRNIYESDLQQYTGPTLLHPAHSFY